MVAVRQDIWLAQGRTFELAVEVLDEDGDPRTDLAGWTGAMQVRASQSSTATLLATATVSINTSTGVVTATIAAADTASAAWRVGWYDLYIASGATKEDLAYGDARLRRTVTA